VKPPRHRRSPRRRTGRSLEEILDLPALDISLLVELPKVITPDLQRLQ
jgi:hypothetical protein